MGFRTSRPLPRLVTLVALVALLGASGDLPASRSSRHDRVDLDRVAPRLGIALVGIALAPRGAGFFDNFLPCARRGVIHHVATEGGRQATFVGCDLGGGVVVEGRGEVRWAEPGQETRFDERFCGFMTSPGLPTCPDHLRWAGSLDVTVDGVSIDRVTDVSVDDLVIADHGRGEFPEALGFETGVLGFASMSVSLDDATVPVSEEWLPQAIFHPAGFTLESIPNPSESLDALADADMRRLAWDAGSFLARLLFDETLEAGREAHTHAMECGTIAVTPVQGTVILDVDWPGCPIRGLVWRGTFRLQWRGIERPDPDRIRFDMLLEGELEIGGAVPRVAIERWTWIADFQMDEDLHLTGEVARGDERRVFDDRLQVDD